MQRIYQAVIEEHLSHDRQAILIWRKDEDDASAIPTPLHTPPCVVTPPTLAKPRTTSPSLKCQARSI